MNGRKETKVQKRLQGDTEADYLWLSIELPRAALDLQPSYLYHWEKGSPSEAINSLWKKCITRTGS